MKTKNKIAKLAIPTIVILAIMVFFLIGLQTKDIIMKDQVNILTNEKVSRGNDDIKQLL